MHIQVLGQQWADLSLEDSIRLGGARIEQEVEQLRGLLEEGQVTIEAKRCTFPQGRNCLITWKTSRPSCRAARSNRDRRNHDDKGVIQSSYSS